MSGTYLQEDRSEIPVGGRSEKLPAPEIFAPGGANKPAALQSALHTPTAWEEIPIWGAGDRGLPGGTDKLTVLHITLRNAPYTVPLCRTCLGKSGSVCTTQNPEKAEPHQTPPTGPVLNVPLKQLILFFLRVCHSVFAFLPSAKFWTGQLRVCADNYGKEEIYWDL
ncbi:hypothetical protein NDU88_004904 [Pleurodeles waltl]|uniref:Uncharacterized protein n=1 Tax=Pleurodeles waltl TaxID=8319 RepID=A0AAV7M9P9_PLEWA|nr:hypothetical protein NDU88_004904 [Pleurodeles waltl]